MHDLKMTFYFSSVPNGLILLKNQIKFDFSPLQVPPSLKHLQRATWA
jgi:hypothetical protein